MVELYTSVYGTSCERLQTLLVYLSERPAGIDFGEVIFPHIFPTSLFLSAAIKGAFHRKGFQSLLTVLLKSLYPPYAANILREVFSKKLAEKRYTLKYDSPERRSLFISES